MKREVEMIHIALEGIDNSGKTTLAESLSEYLLQKGIRAKLTKELTSPIGQFSDLRQSRRIDCEPLKAVLKPLATLVASFFTHPCWNF